MVMSDGDVDVGNNMKIKFNKIYDALRLGKGYYELIGVNEDDVEVIFRFNNAAFLHNYSIADLFDMNLTLYGMESGRKNPEQLDFEYYMDSLSSEQVAASINEPSEKTKQLVMFDIVLAGVESRV
ncbi:DUF6414 family protein [Sporolactobacillus spathodeae]|uniref:Uncharacterized protein n=2 Tax=Sporolactobacillus spathodeae TaxID=1465502 RepID=A0ABS2QAQ2_9BACL|nr:hypothetical protein [Sporolactobacillus spathodeae]